MTMYQLHIECHSCRRGSHDACSSKNQGYAIKICCTCSVCARKKSDDISHRWVDPDHVQETDNELQPDELGGHSLVVATLTDTPSTDDDTS